MATFEELRGAYMSRKPHYESASLKVAVTSRERNVGEAFRGALTFQPHESAEPFTHDYGELRQIHRTYEPEEAIEVLETFLNQGETPFAANVSVTDVEVEGPDAYHGNDWTEPIGYPRRGKWPAIRFRLGGPRSPDYPTGPILEPGLPPLTDPRSEMEDWMGLERSDLRNGGLEVVLPDYRARLSSIRFREQDVQIQAEANIGADSLQLRTAVDARGQRSQEIDVERDGLSFVAQTRKLPDVFYAFLVGEDDSDVIDWCRINTGSDKNIDQVEFAQPEQKLRQTIEQGESSKVEFKEMVGDGARILESVVAFANTDGGRILVGVDDNGQVVGTDEYQRLHDSLGNWIHEKCDPTIEVDIERVSIDGEGVAIIDVPEGEHKPYQHRRKRVFYVRRGASDRPATRSEVDEFYSNQGNSNMTAGF